MIYVLVSGQKGCWRVMNKSVICHILINWFMLCYVYISLSPSLPLSPIQTDGCMSSYGNLPSNLLMSGESVYENFSVPLPYLSPDNNYDNKTPSTSDYDNHTSMDAGPSSNVYDNTAITDSVSYCS